MAVDEKVLERIKKLLALGTSPNEHEAALAIAKAQEIMEAHGLAMEDVSAATKSPDNIGQSGATVYAVKGKPDAWRTVVVRAVAQTSDIMVTETWMEHHRTVKGRDVRTYEEGLAFIGFKADLEMARYSVDFLLSELQRLCDEYVATRWQEVWDYADNWGMSHQEAESDWVKVLGNKHPLAARKYWLEGAAQGVSETLRAARAERRGDNTNLNALVVRKDREVKNWWYEKRYGKTYDAMQEENEADFRESEAKRALWVQEHPNDVGTKRDPEWSPPYRSRASRATGAAEDAQYRAYARKQAKRDNDAYSAGVATGRRVGVRPGVGAPTSPAGRIDR